MHVLNGVKEPCEEVESSNKLAHLSAAISLTCIAIMVTVVPIIYYQLENANKRIQIKMKAFEVSFCLVMLLQSMQCG